MSRFAFLIAMPIAMLAVLFHTLRISERERRAWTTLDASALKKPTTSEGIESIPFIFPFQHSARVQDAIGFQWPAFAVAGMVAPVPQMSSRRKPIPLTLASYLALTIAVGIYWFAIAAWVERRLIQRRKPVHSKVARIILSVIVVLTGLFLVLFLGKDLVGGWPEGAQGAYGVTAWLALVSFILLVELGGSRRKRIANAEP